VPLCYTCAIPGSTVPIRIRLRVVSGIQYRLDPSVRPSSSVCGILIGFKARSGITEITGFQPVAAMDSAVLEEGVSKTHSGIVGFYRSTGQGELHISEEDVRLAKTLSNNAVILLIEADQSGVGEAALVVGNCENVISDSVEVRFPFDAQQLAALEVRRSEATMEDGSGVPSGFGIFERQAGRPPRIVTFAGIAMVAGVGLYLLNSAYHRVTTESVSPVRQERPSVGQLAAKSSLAFSVESRGPALLLTWNRESAQITNASLGMMIIWSQGTIRNLTLTAEQLRSGSILYKPVSDQVEFQLAVMSGDHVTQESAIVLLPERDTLAASTEVRNIVSSKSIRSTSISSSGERARSGESTHPAERQTLRAFSSPAGPVVSEVASSNAADSSSKETPPPNAAPAHKARPKLTLRLRNKGAAVVLAREPSVALALQQHPSTLGKLTQSGSLFTVASGTAVNTSQLESGLAKVLIMEGSMAGQEGWVQAWQVTTK
jgi:hypothetical protein